MDQTEFINAYIETLSKKLQESITNSVMLETKVAIAEKAIATLTLELEEARNEIEKLSKKTKPVSDF